MCIFCEELSRDTTPRGEALLVLLLRLHYGVLEHRLEMLGGEQLWLSVMGQSRHPLPPFARFDFGCLGCSTIRRLAIDLKRYHANWSVLA